MLEERKTKETFKFFELTFWFLLLCLNIFLSLNRHSKSGINNYHSEIWADKAGYYVYLPATFIYDWTPSNMPDSIDLKTGNGFVIDIHEGKIKTKYTYGVALMQFPFFIINHYLNETNNSSDIGFDRSSARTISIAGAFWLTAGLYAFSFILRRYMSGSKAIISSIILLTGTNLLYYGIIDGGMSHVYSFFLFSSFIELFLRSLENQEKSLKIFIGFLIGLIIIVRPINALFFLLITTLALYNRYITIAHIRSVLLNPFTFLFATLPVIPQMIYWNYTFNQPIIFAYQGESFANILKPELLKFLFAPHNGLIPNNPIWALLIISPFFIPTIKRRAAISFSIAFFTLTAIFASWWNWNYGCGFGCRSLSEYTAIFALPFFIMNSEKNKLLTTFKILSLIAIAINLKLTFSYDHCWQHSDWDWNHYLNILFGPTR